MSLATPQHEARPGSSHVAGDLGQTTTDAPKGPLPLVIGVTGHRDLRPEDREPLLKEVRDVFQKIQSTYRHTPLVLLSSLAEGADRLVARVALESGARLVAPLPMLKEVYEADFQDPESLAEFRDLLGRAGRWFVLDEGRAHDAPQGAERDLCYERAGAYIARNCQILIALWDGMEPGKTGGTAEVVRFHLEGVPAEFDPALSLLDLPEAGPVYHIVTPRAGRPQPEQALTCIDLFPRVSTSDAEAKDAFGRMFLLIDGFNRDALAQDPSAEEARRLSRSYVLTESEAAKLPAGIRSMLDRYALADTLAIGRQRRTRRTLISLLALAFVVTCLFQSHIYLRKHYPWKVVARDAEPGSTNVAHAAKPGGTNDAVPRNRYDTYWIVRNIYPWGIDPTLRDELGKPDSPNAPRAKPGVINSKPLADEPLVEREAFQLARDDEIWLAGYDLIYLGFTFALFFFYGFKRAMERDDHKRYLDYRALAEGLRVQIYWRLASLRDSAADHYLRKQKGELDWIRAAIRAGDILDGKEVPTDDAGGEKDRLGLVLERWVKGQVLYFVGEARHAKAGQHRSRMMNHWLAFLGSPDLAEDFEGKAQARRSDREGWKYKALRSALPTCIVLFAVARGFAPSANPVVIALVLTTAALGLFGSYGKIMAFSEHAKQYGRMGILFSNAQRHLKVMLENGDHDAARDLIKDLGEEALAENGDWVLLHRERPLELPRP